MHKPIKELLDKQSLYLFQPKARSLYKSMLFVLLLPWMMAANLFCKKPAELLPTLTLPTASVLNPPSYDPNAPPYEPPPYHINPPPYHINPPPYTIAPPDSSELPKYPPPYEPSAPTEDLSPSDEKSEEMRKEETQKLDEDDQGIQALDKDNQADKVRLKKAKKLKKATSKKEAKEKAEKYLAEADACIKKCKGGFFDGGYEKRLIERAKDEENWERRNKAHGFKKLLWGSHMQNRRRNQKAALGGKLQARIKLGKRWLELAEENIKIAEERKSKSKCKSLRKTKEEYDGELDDICRVMAKHLQIPVLSQMTTGQPEPSYAVEP
ncbi:MAG: hypothetical protein K2X94_03740 [Amoebophilaceae bacterium]|nr:hypothetical protein [Amoebophilaceae bacterium]